MARGRHPTRIHIDPPDEATAAKYLHSWYAGDVRKEPHRFPKLSSQELFGNNNPIEIDFGCGTGILMCSRAKQYPHVNFLGIDQSQKPLFCAIRDAVSLNLDNIKFIRGNFSVMFPLLPEKSVATAFYLFPNPPQDYHIDRANLRRKEFLQSMYQSLVPGGRFFFATDSNLLFTSMTDILHHTLHLRTIQHVIDDSDISTRYRSIWEERGRSVKSFVVEK